MSLEIAIFLSSGFLGIIILFISTKDRWNWKKIILWPVLVLVGLSILLGVGYYIYQSISNRPEPQTSFWGISLDSTRGDIKFLKGEPDKDSDDENWVYVKVVKKFGKPSYVSISEDELVRILSYDRYHVFFVLKENAVWNYGIYNSPLGKVKFEKEKKTD